MVKKIRKISVKIIIIIIFTLAAQFVLPVLLSCKNNGQGTNEMSSSELSGNSAAAKTILNITVSIPPQAEFVEEIGGSNVIVTVLVPPGADPHTFELKPSQMKSLDATDAYFALGSGIEFEIVWMDKITGLNRDMPVYNCSENIKFISGSGEQAISEFEGSDSTKGNDPHIWLSLKNAMIISENIYNGLTELDPENKQYYYSNKVAYQKKLSDLDKIMEESLKNIKNKKFIVYHSAWKYFARDYGLQEISIESSGKEPTAEKLKQVIDLAVQNNIRVIFASPQFSLKSAAVIANETGAEIVLVDPLDRNYLANMKKVSEDFRKIFNPGK
jgi:zinc transport system substrate-binding protein